MKAGTLRLLLRYAVLFAAAVAAYFSLRFFGLGLHAGLGAAPARAAGGDAAEVLGPVMVALAVVTTVSRLLGAISRRWFGQPPVIGEILAGILLGPSLLGTAAPAASAWLFPPAVIPALGVIAKIGVVLFMFVIGLEIDLPALRRASRSTLSISSAGIVLPFLLGAALALLLYPRYGAADVGFTAFSLFLGVSLSLTAFPVLARILREFSMQHTAFGLMALACAAIGDVSAWTLLALIVGVVTHDVTSMLTTVALIVAYLALMVVVVGPLLRKLAARSPVGASAEGASVPQGRLALAFVGLLASAAATEFIGIHALFGAFFFGLLLPADSALARSLRRGIEDLVAVLFLPAFFAFTGLRTQIGLLVGLNDWLACGLVVLVATVGKFGGTYFSARVSGMGRDEASALGVLMNARGLVELIVLNIGLELGVLDPRLFTMLVLMALATTFAASPLFGRIIRISGFNSALSPASGGALAP